MPGHYDELRGRVRPAGDSAGRDNAARPPLTADWTAFFELLGRDGFADLERRTALMRRQLRDNGVTYNVYADAANPQRPWSLDLRR